ncbi:MAG: transposase [Actinobacteria bacterium]|nr:transposase [Actinomycetota bacterium]
MTLHRDVVGIDISKLHLDIHDNQSGVTRRIANSAAEAAELAASLAERECLVVFEATGRYDTALRHALGTAGIAHARVNPEQARNFARATGRRAKTDAIDARMLAELGERLSLRLEPPANPARERLTLLIRRRDQLVLMRKQERVRTQSETDPLLKADIAAHIAWLDHAIARTEQEITKLMREDEVIARTDALLRSAPGVGPVTAAVLIGHLPELGILPAKAVTALAGLAPYNNDSGAFRGQRSVRGGRTRIRQALYMAAVSIARGSSSLAAFHKRLIQAGKPPKVAIIATARKLLTTLNAILKQRVPFSSPA